MTNCILLTVPLT